MDFRGLLGHKIEMNSDNLAKWIWTNKIYNNNLVLGSKKSIVFNRVEVKVLEACQHPPHQTAPWHLYAMGQIVHWKRVLQVKGFHCPLLEDGMHSKSGNKLQCMLPAVKNILYLQLLSLSSRFVQSHALSGSKTYCYCNSGTATNMYILRYVHAGCSCLSLYTSRKTGNRQTYVCS